MSFEQLKNRDNFTIHIRTLIDILTNYNPNTRVLDIPEYNYICKSLDKIYDIFKSEQERCMPDSPYAMFATRAIATTIHDCMHVGIATVDDLKNQLANINLIYAINKDNLKMSVSCYDYTTTISDSWLHRHSSRYDPRTI